MLNKTIAKLCLGAVAASCVTAAPAQSAQELLQAAITKQGRSCPQVTAMRGFATTEDGTPLLAAACSNGDRHVVKLLPGERLEYMFTCDAIEARADVKCFPSGR